MIKFETVVHIKTSSIADENHLRSAAKETGVFLHAADTEHGEFWVYFGSSLKLVAALKSRLCQLIMDGGK